MEKQRNMTSIFLCTENKILLLFRQGSKVVNNMWIGSAGGHFEEYELNDARACVLRELKEELSVEESMLSDLQLRYITMRNVGEEVRINYFFFANLKNAEELELQSDEGMLKWFHHDEIKNLEMSFSAKYVMEHYLEIGRFNQVLYGGIASGEEMIFTEMPE